MKNANLSFKLTEPGIYVLGTDGATGKTYINTVLRYIKLYKTVPVDFITPDSDVDDMCKDVIARLLSSTADIVIIDRVDLFIDDRLVRALLSIKNKFLLLDLKSMLWSRKLPYHIARVIRDRECITVEALS